MCICVDDVLGHCLRHQLNKLMKPGLKLIVYISWLPYAFKLKKRFPLGEGFIASLGILDRGNSMPNVDLDFPHLVPEDQLLFLDDE